MHVRFGVWDHFERRPGLPLDVQFQQKITLLQEAEQRFAKLRIHNITAITGDGMKGWPAQAPFDRIIVTAAADERPQALIDQLALGGILVVPVGRDPTAQVVERIVKSEDGLKRDTLMPVRFVPLVTGPLPVLGQG